jgi:hypothetical protein
MPAAMDDLPEALLPRSTTSLVSSVPTVTAGRLPARVHGEERSDLPWTGRAAAWSGS